MTQKARWLLDWAAGDEDHEPIAEELAFRAAVKRIAWIGLVAGVVLWASLIGANACVKAAAREHEATGRVVWQHDVEGEVIRRKPNQMGYREMSRDGLGILLDGRSDPVVYQRPKPSKLGTFEPGDRVRVRYVEGGAWFLHHFRIDDVQKLPAADGGRR